VVAASEFDTLRLLHELQVHQVELAQQNVELKNARADLEASADLYFRLYEFAPVGLVTLNRGGIIREVNRYGQDLLGGSVDSLVGACMFDMLIKSSRRELEHALAAPIDAEHAFNALDLMVAVPAVAERVLRAEMHPRPAVDDCVLLALTDITEQKRAQADLAQTRELLDMSNRVARIGYWQVAQGAESTWSAVAREIFDVPPGHMPDIKEILGCLKDDESRDKIHAAHVNAMKRGRTFDLEIPITTFLGRKRWIRVTGRAEARRNGQRCMLGTVQDIDAHVEAEAARTARARAEMANRSKNEFLSRMSHELRTPLNAVLGFSELLELSSVVSSSPAVAAHVQHIHDAGQHLLAMIDEILDLTCIESGDMQIVMKPLELSAVLGECMTLVEPLAMARTVTLHFAAHEVDLHVSGDRTRLRQVLVNLLSNAIKYNREGGSVQIELSDREGRVAISVRDTGQGMSPDQLCQLFQPFNRLGAEHSGIAGTGLGLVIAKQLVEVDAWCHRSRECARGGFGFHRALATRRHGRVALPRQCSIGDGARVRLWRTTFYRALR